MLETKRALFEACEEYIKDRIKTAEHALADNRAGLDDDSKSSAGDKYETSREIVQQEVIRNELLLKDARTMEGMLTRINIEPTYTYIQNGSIAVTNHGIFFFAIAIGKVQVDQKDFFVISISSPLGQVFKDKKSGEKVTFNGKVYLIKEVY